MNLRNALTCSYGMTRSGKSELLRAIWISQAGPKCMIDVKDEAVDRLPGVPTVSNPRDILLFPTTRAVPPDPEDDAWYNELYSVAVKNELLVWLDEGGVVTSPNQAPRKLKTFHLTILGKGGGHMIAAQSPADSWKGFEKQSTHFFFFEMQHDLDIKAVARITGLSEAYVEQMFNEVKAHRVSSVEPSHHFLYYSKGMGEMWLCDPLDDPDRLTALIARCYFGPYDGEKSPEPNPAIFPQPL